MKKYLLLFFLLLCSQQLAFAQFREMLATTSPISKSGTKQSQATSLIDGLNSLEETFEVSIAFKDELVIGKLAPSKLKQYPSVEHGLKELLSGTDLDFEKAAGIRDEVAHLRNLLLKAGEEANAIGAHGGEA